MVGLITKTLRAITRHSALSRLTPSPRLDDHLTWRETPGREGSGPLPLFFKRGKLDAEKWRRNARRISGADGRIVARSDRRGGGKGRARHCRTVAPPSGRGGALSTVSSLMWGGPGLKTCDDGRRTGEAEERLDQRAGSPDV